MVTPHFAAPRSTLASTESLWPAPSPPWRTAHPASPEQRRRHEADDHRRSVIERLIELHPGAVAATGSSTPAN